MRRTRTFWTAAVLTLALAPAASAETYVVTGTADNVGICEGTTCTSIRQALASAASNPGADIVTVPAGTYQLTEGALQITSDVTLRGDSARTTTIVANLNNQARALEIQSATATVQSVTLRGGHADGAQGGTLRNQGGTVALDRVRVTGGSAASGGGIANRNGAMEIRNSLIDGNTATSDGGGIINFGGEFGSAANLTIGNSTIAFNSAPLAAGLTSAGNDQDAMTLDHVTIARNIATTGAGGINLPATGVFSIGSTIVADNTPSNCGGAQPTSAGYNLENGHECRFGQEVDVHDVGAGLDATLSDQGGETDVLPIATASPARNLGPLNCVSTDQRGAPRPRGPRCDAGAFELAYGTAIDSGPSGPTRDARPSFAFSSSDAIDGFTCRLDGPGGTLGTYAQCTSPANLIADLAEGAYTFRVQAMRGGEPFSSASRDFVVDLTPPETTIKSGPTPSGANSVEFALSANEDGATFSCQLDGLTGAPDCPNGTVDYEQLVTGTRYTFTAAARDRAGNVDPTPVSFAFTYGVGPAVAFTTAPPATTNDNTPTFAFSSDPGASFECRLDGAEFTPCSTPITLTAVTDGPHTFTVAASLNGQRGEPAATSFTVDTAAPPAPTLAGPSGPTGSSSAEFTFASDEPGARFECAIDAAEAADCASPFTLRDVPNGEHRLEVVVLDLAGNRSAPASRTWTVDTVAPGPPVIETPAQNALVASTFTVTGSAEPGATVALAEGAEARGSTVASGTGAWSIAVTAADGAHTYTATATDAAGNAGLASAERTVRVDGAAPETTIVSGPGGYTNDDTPTFTFASDDPEATFECSLDSGDFLACPREFTTAKLTEDAHTLVVRAVDPSGNRDATPPNRVFTVDTTAPVAPDLTDPVSGLVTRDPAVTLKGTTEPRTDVRIFDGGMFVDLARITDEGGITWDLPLTLTAGVHTFTARAVDRAGNESPLSGTVTVTVDQTGPASVTITGGGLTNDPTPTFTLTSEAGATFTCAVDAGDPVDCESPYTVEPALLDGPHTLHVVAYDAAGNASPEAHADVTVDTVAPSIAITADPGVLTNDTTPTFRFGSADAGATFMCSVDAATPAACTSPSTLAELADGQHSFRVSARDGAGNESAPDTRTFTVDATAPAAAFTGGPGGPTRDTTPTFTYTAEAGATLTCAVDGVAEPTCEAPHTLAPLADGDHIFEVRAADAAGNARTITRSFTVDTVAPVATITTGPTEGQVVTIDSVRFDFTLSEPGTTSLCRLAFDGEPLLQQGCTTSFSETDMRNGAYTFEVTPTDAAGNVGAPVQRSFTVAHGGPQATIVDGLTLTNDTTPTFKINGPAGSTFKCEIVARLPPVDCNRTQGYTPIFALIPDGPYTFRVIAYDLDKDPGPPATLDFIVDTKAPTATVTAPGGPTREPRFSFASSEGGTFECRIDGGAAAACASPYAPAIADGAHTLAVVAIDAAGNRSAVVSRAFTVDTTAPAAPDVTADTQGNAATFSFASPESTFACRLEGPGRDGNFEACSSPKIYGGLAAGSYRFTLRTTDAAGNTTDAPAREFAVAAVVVATPTATPTPRPTETPRPQPEFQERVVVRPVEGKIYVKRPGTNDFIELPATGAIPLGSTVDARKGKVQLTAEPGQGRLAQKATFYGGIFLITQPGTTIDLKLVEPLAPCSKRARSSAAKKPKTRQLWGEGKGAFRTTGTYSAATVRGTTWLVQDSCTGTLTRVKVGVVAVRDNAKKKTVLLRAGKSYIAKPRR